MLSKEELWEDCIGLARHMAFRKWRKLPSLISSHDDLLQAAYVGLWEACLSWKEGGKSFPNWALLYINGRLNKEVSKLMGWNKEVGETQSNNGFYPKTRSRIVVNWDGKNNNKEQKTWGEVDMPFNSPNTSLDEKEFLDFIIHQLSTQKRKIVARRYYLEGLPMVSIAHQLAVSVQTISRMLQETFAEMETIANGLKRKWEKK
jgi:RNA polymerase sigma factor (sigma-70 family)